MAEKKKSPSITKSQSVVKSVASSVSGGAKPPADLFAKELLKKENSLIIGHFRHDARMGKNPVLRAMHLGEPLFQGTATASASKFEAPVSKESTQDYVQDEGGKVLLSRGILPSMIPARHTSFPTKGDWMHAEIKHNILKNELMQLQQEIKLREKDISEKIDLATGGSSSNGELHNVATLRMKPGSSVWGSSYQWESVTTNKSSSQAEYSWPKIPFKTYEISRTQYGQLTKQCDDPCYLSMGTFVNPNAKSRKPKS